MDDQDKSPLQESLRAAWANARALLERLHTSQAAIERRVDEGVRAAVQRVRAPIVTELASLRERLDTLARRIDRLRAKKDGRE